MTIIRRLVRYKIFFNFDKNEILILKIGNLVLTLCSQFFKMAVVDFRRMACF